MMQKNSQLSLIVSNPKLPGKRIDPQDKSAESRKWSPLAELLRRWKQRRKSIIEPTPAERLEIEARISNQLYPKRLIR
jgi:hypothetical protein